MREVLTRNRGYLEMTIPMDVIITTLEADNVLLPYELHQVKSHALLIEKNRSFLDSLMRKSPDMFYTFCSIMEGLPGCEYIGRYLRAEMKDVDPTVPFDEKVECSIVYSVSCLCGKCLCVLYLMTLNTHFITCVYSNHNAKLSPVQVLYLYCTVGYMLITVFVHCIVCLVVLHCYLYRL